MSDVIERWKMYDEYTEEERAMLPPLPPNAKNERGVTPYMWDGKHWGWVMID